MTLSALWINTSRGWTTGGPSLGLQAQLRRSTVLPHGRECRPSQGFCPALYSQLPLLWVRQSHIGHLTRCMHIPIADPGSGRTVPTYAYQHLYQPTSGNLSPGKGSLCVWESSCTGRTRWVQRRRNAFIGYGGVGGGV